jgi:hypothetical protein
VAPLFSTPAVVALGGSLHRFFESPLALLVRGHSRCTLTVPEAVDARLSSPPPPPPGLWSVAQWNNWKSIAMPAMHMHTAISHSGIGRDTPLHRVVASNVALGKCMSSRPIRVVNGLHAIPLSSKPTTLGFVSRGVLTSRWLRQSSRYCYVHLKALSIVERSFLVTPMQRPLHVGSRSFFNITISDYV